MSVDQVRSIVDRINAAWLHGPPSEIVARVEPCFHRDAVMYAPGFQGVARGSATIAASYRDFVTKATVEQCTFGDLSIDVVGDTGTAVCPWMITYTLDGTSYTESGHDVLVFTHDDSGWRVVWRTMVPSTP